MYLLVGERLVKSWRQEMMRKYMLANLRNCSNRFFGRKVIMLYFEVVTVLLQYLNVAFRAGMQEKLEKRKTEK